MVIIHGIQVEIKKVKNVLVKEQLSVKAFYEKNTKDLENRFNVEIKKVKNLYDQTTKALEIKILRESEALRKKQK